MSSTQYEQLVHKQAFPCSSQVAESQNSYHVLTERHLQAMWLEQKYFKSLTTSAGIPIQVLSPGIWNAESGPDFLKAHLRIGSNELRGDIELHLSDDSWYHHKHHLDQRYDDVILHVGFWNTDKNNPILTSAGKTLICTHLKPLLTIPEARIVKLIDLDLYPYKHFVGSGQCAGTLFSSLPESKALFLFRSASAWRLKQKRQHLLAKFANPADALLGGIAMALGYKQNAEAFFDLYCRMKTLKLQNEQMLFAYAMGACGFFNAQYRRKWSASIYYQSLAKHYDSLTSAEQMTQISLRLDKIRPANHPIRRLAILAKLLADRSLENLAAATVMIWQKYWQQGAGDNRIKLVKQLLEVLPTYRDTYWEHHYTFETAPKVKSLALMGGQLQQEILLNVCLPLLYEEIELRNSPDELEAFLQIYASMPASKARKSTYLAQRFFGNMQKKKLLTHADTQQGAYQIHRDFCMHYEASCIGCPFVERYVKAFGS